LLQSQVFDEAKYIKATKADRLKQIQELQVKLEEQSFSELNHWTAFEEETQSNMNAVLESDDSRRIAFQLAYDEEQQMIAVRWSYFALNFYILSCCSHNSSTLVDVVVRLTIICGF